MSLCNDALPLFWGKGGIYIKGSNGTKATFRVEQGQYWRTGKIRNISFIFWREGGGGCGKFICISGTLEQVPSGIAFTMLTSTMDMRDWYKCGLKETGLSLYMFRKWRANHARIPVRSFDGGGGGGRGWSNSDNMFLVDDGREDLNTTKSGATIGPPARRHFNGVSLAGR